MTLILLVALAFSLGLNVAQEQDLVKAHRELKNWQDAVREAVHTVNREQSLRLQLQLELDRRDGKLPDFLKERQS